MTIIEQAEEEIAIFERPSVQTSKKLIAKVKELELALENTQQRLALIDNPNITFKEVADMGDPSEKDMQDGAKRSTQRLNDMAHEHYIQAMRGMLVGYAQLLRETASRIHPKDPALATRYLEEAEQADALYQHHPKHKE